MLPNDPETAVKILHDLKQQTQGLVLEIRRLVYALRSSTLDELGLMGSLRESIEGFHGVAHGLRISLEGDEQALRRLPAAYEQAAERIAQEALTNTVRHASANCCRLIMEVQEGSLPLLQMTIEDDSLGLQPGYSPGVGIASMIDRAETLGGSVKFEPNRPQGTRVVVRLPLPNDPPSSER
jgi:signal transduction histidine kinase